MKLEFYRQIFEKYPKYPLLLSDLNEIGILSTDFGKVPKTPVIIVRFK